MVREKPLLSTEDKLILRQPIQMNPNNFTPNIWGGDWIPIFKDIPPPPHPVGESWEFSTHPDHPNDIQLPSGAHVTLRELWANFPREISGKQLSAGKNTDAPFMIKLIDSKDDLSVQVHPDDENARVMENKSGKAEAWFILGTNNFQEEGFIYLGFNEEKADQYKNHADFGEAFLSAVLQANSLGPTLDPIVREKSARLIIPFLNKVKVKAGEVYYLSPGTIHAVGRGVRLFEIQQPSDVTYRLWDWNRPDTRKSKKNTLVFRPLHIEKARQVLDFTPRKPSDYFQKPCPLSSEGKGTFSEERIIEELRKRFAANHISLGTGDSELTCHPQGRFHVLTVIKGHVQLFVAETPESSLHFFREINQGHSVLIPAIVDKYVLRSSKTGVEVIKSYVPV